MEKPMRSEKLLIEEVSRTAGELRSSVSSLTVGDLLGMIRKLLGMSQEELSNRSGVEQATISRVEHSLVEPSMSTIRKLADALECDLLVIPVPRKPIDDIRREQARRVAKRKASYLQGTMSLEDQEPDNNLLEALIDQEQEDLLKSGKRGLWQE